jgi:hypothetical protein
MVVQFGVRDSGCLHEGAANIDVVDTKLVFQQPRALYRILPQGKPIDLCLFEARKVLFNVCWEALAVGEPVAQAVLAELRQVAAVKVLLEFALLLLRDVSVHIGVQAAERDVGGPCGPADIEFLPSDAPVFICASPSTTPTRHYQVNTKHLSPTSTRDRISAQHVHWRGRQGKEKQEGRDRRSICEAEPQTAAKAQETARRIVWPKAHSVEGSGVTRLCPDLQNPQNYLSLTCRVEGRRGVRVRISILR